MPFSPIKQQIRSRYGSIKAFEQAKELRPHAVRDHLRGRSVSAAENAIVAEFGNHDLERPRLKRRRTNEEQARIAAEAMCERRLTELRIAIENAENAARDLQAIVERRS